VLRSSKQIAVEIAVDTLVLCLERSYTNWFLEVWRDRPAGWLARIMWQITVFMLMFVFNIRFFVVNAKQLSILF